MGGKVSSIKEYLKNAEHISSEKIMQRIYELQVNGHDFDADFNKGWLNLLEKKIDLFDSYKSKYYKDCKVLSYIKLIIELSNCNTTIDIKDFTEDELIKALTKINIRHIKNRSLFFKMIEQIKDKSAFANEIKLFNFINGPSN